MAQQNNYPFKQNGYIYSKGTAQGFLRMQRQGIPRPIFRIEDKLRTILKKAYEKVVRKIMREFMIQAKANGITKADLTEDAESDDVKALMDFFDEMARQEQSADDAQKAAELKAALGNVQSNLNGAWDTDNPEPIGDDIAGAVENILLQNQQDYMARLSSDAGDTLGRIISAFSIDKQKLYNDNMENIRTLYLNNTIERIGWEENWLKKQFLQKIADYVEGRSDTLDIQSLTKGMLHDGARMAQFFARDQLSRLNKATTLSTFVNAGVTKIKWVTTHDVRVRDSHRALDGKVFDINNLPSEIDDYNCRCGLVPVEWAE